MMYCNCGWHGEPETVYPNKCPQCKKAPLMIAQGSKEEIDRWLKLMEKRRERAAATATLEHEESLAPKPDHPAR